MVGFSPLASAPVASLRADEFVVFFFQPSGSYEFDEIADFGAVSVVQARSFIESVLLDASADLIFFDSIPGLFDSREGFFDGLDNQNDLTNVRMQFSQTNDDPSGSPTWSEYRDFVVADVTARALRFRAILETNDLSVAPAVEQLGVVLVMPTRVEAGNDISVTGTANINFANAFTSLENRVPSISISAVLADGDRYEITNKTNAGFTITIYTGSVQSSNAATIDYVATGIGKIV